MTTTSVKTRLLPGTDITAPNIVLGLMRIAEKTDDEIRALVKTANDHGIDFIDHADIYGGELHRSERRWAEATRLSPAERDTVTIQTKAGIRNPGPFFDFSFEHLVRSAEASLEALQTDRIDVFLLHRPDALVEPEEVARAFDHLHETGKVRHFGVSNHTPRQIDLLKTAVRQPIVANQVQLSLAHAPIIAQGVDANVAGNAQSVGLDGGGIIDYARLNDITLQAWSPFQKGGGAGAFLGDPDSPELNAAIDRIAAEYDVPAIAVATAWITRHPAWIQVVLGTTTPERVAGAARGSELPLSREEWYELFRAAGYRVP